MIVSADLADWLEQHNVVVYSNSVSRDPGYFTLNQLLVDQFKNGITVHTILQAIAKNRRMSKELSSLKTMRMQNGDHLYARQNNWKQLFSIFPKFGMQINQDLQEELLNGSMLFPSFYYLHGFI